MRKLLVWVLGLFFVSHAAGQGLSPNIPQTVDTTAKYLFYLHGGIIQEVGIDAVSEYYGKYEYIKILDTLSSRGFFVISERRPKGTDEIDYAGKVFRQIDTLLRRGVPVENITVVGASQGAYIAVETANLLMKPKVKYALLGLCSEYAVGYFLKYRKKLCGDFLSIYESSDPKASCDKILNDKNCKDGYREIRLDMGNSHAFLYKPYREWVDPLVDWASMKSVIGGETEGK